MEYTHIFDTEAKKEIAYDSDDYKEPWVSYTEENESTAYNKIPTIITVTANKDTSLTVYYTSSSLSPDMKISLTANEKKTITINKAIIYKIGCLDKSYITQISIDGAIKYLNQMFYNYINLVDCDLTKLDVTHSIDCAEMFNGCTNLTKLDLSSWDTSHIKIMRSMFWRCSKLQNLDVSHFDLSNTTDTSYMFYNCSSLKTVGPIDTAKGWQYKPSNYDVMFFGCPAQPRPVWYDE